MSGLLALVASTGPGECWTAAKRVCAEWIKACHDVTEGAVVAIDGKTLRGSYCRGKGILARIRHIALNYLKGEKTFKGGIRRKKKKPALDETYLVDILAV